MANQGSFVRYSFMPPNSRDASARNDESTLGELPLTTPQSAGGKPARDVKGIVKGRGRLIASDSGSVDTNRDASGKQSSLNEDSEQVPMQVLEQSKVVKLKNQGK